MFTVALYTTKERNIRAECNRLFGYDVQKELSIVQTKETDAGTVSTDRPKPHICATLWEPNEDSRITLFNRQPSLRRGWELRDELLHVLFGDPINVDILPIPCQRPDDVLSVMRQRAPFINGRRVSEEKGRPRSFISMLTRTRRSVLREEIPRQ